MNAAPYSLETTDDAFLGGRLNLLQSRHALRAGLDAVFLAASIPAQSRSGDYTILDVGTGCGVVGLCILSRIRDAQLTGIDVNANLVALARQNAERNGLSDVANFHDGDVRALRATMTDCELLPNSFDHVVANPPFFETGTVQRAPNDAKDLANVMAPGDLDLWARFMTNAAKANGMLTMVHKADALPDLFAALKGRFGGLCVFPLFPRVGMAASRVLVQGRKGSRRPLQLLQGLVLHEDDGSFTPQAERILRHGAELVLEPASAVAANA